jgi:hypothetical protein
VYNDSTFALHGKVEIKGDERIGSWLDPSKPLASETWHFRAYSPKPDSTNIFVR